MPDKEQRKAAWERKKAKRRKDHNNGKNGWVSGNPRYERGTDDGADEDTTPVGRNKSMGSN